MTEKRYGMSNETGAFIDKQINKEYTDDEIIDLLNEQHEENEQLKSNLKDCMKLKTKRLNKIRNHRAVIEDLGGSIRAYKGKIEQTNEKIDKIKEAMEDTGALTKRQLEEILND